MSLPWAPPPSTPHKSWLLMHKGLVVVIAGAVAGGAVVAGVVSRGSSGPPAYLASSARSVEFVTWQPVGSGIQGTIASDSITGTAPDETVSVQSVLFTGSITSSTVTMTINGGFLVGTRTATATLHGGALSFSFIGSSGSLQTSTLVQSSASAYNAAVALLHKNANHANVLAAAVLARQRRQTAKAAGEQAAANTTAAAVAQAGCKQFGGSWSSPGTVNYSADGYTFSIPGGAQDASCDNVPYLGSDDATYYVSISFAATGAAQAAGSGTGTATASECSRGYYPDASTGNPAGKPGNWSSVLGICLTNG